MGINMDFKKRLEYKFINLDGLDENVQSEIKDILKSDIPPEVVKLPWTNDNNCITNYDTIETQDATNEWQNYGETDDNGVMYDVQETPASIVTSTNIPYPGAFMPVQYSDLQRTNTYTGSDGNTYPSYVPYTGPIYGTQTNDIISSSPNIRDTERRRNINRSYKNDYNTRILNNNNNNNNIHQNYMIPSHYTTIPTVCHSPSGMQFIGYTLPTTAQTHQVNNRAVFVTPHQYNQQHIHHTNNHQQYSHQNYQIHHHSSGNTKHHQRSTNQYYFNPDIPKISHNKTDKKYDVNQSIQQLSNNNINTNSNNNVNDVPKKNVASNNDVAKKIQTVEKKLTIDNNNEIKKETKTQVINVENKIVDKIIKIDKKNTQIKKEEILNVTPIIEKNTNNDKNDNKISKEIKLNGDVKIKNIEIPEKIKTIVNDTKITTPTVTTSSSTSVTTSTTNQEQNINTIKSTIPVNEIKNSTVTVPPPISSFASALKKKGPDSSIDRQPSRYIPIKTTDIIENSTQQKSQSETLKNQCKLSTKDNNINSSVKPIIKSSINGDNKKSKNNLYNNSLNDPNIYRLGEFLLNYEIDKQTVSLLPRGLTNRSNYCYINSILQALLACPPFYNLFKALSSEKTQFKNSPTPLIDNMIKFINEFSQLSSSSRLSRLEKRTQKKSKDTAIDIQCGTAFEPSYVYTMLKNTSCSNVFSIEGRQEDAEEFLSCLLNGISDEMLELMKQVNNDQINDTNINSIGGNDNINGGDDDEEEWTMIGPKNKGSITRCTEIGRTPLSDIFRGQLRSRISRQGDQYSDNVQPFFTLQLDIEKAESVEGALDILVGRDQVEGMVCSKTKQQIQAWKQVTLEELPVILILHLKWFNYQLEGCSKIFKNVSYAIDLKIDSKILTSSVAKKLSVKEKQYKLFAVTYHDGKEATKGHYVTDAFHVSYGAWVRYDDSSVKCVSQNDVLNPSTPRVPYLLYYRRSDTIGNNQITNMRTR